MLSGAILSAAPVSLRGLAPGLPPARPALLALVMQALHASETSFLGTRYGARTLYQTYPARRTSLATSQSQLYRGAH
ncbi:unnamed protein product [Leptosia nina]|uniref:Secreted protein n=1 Tax=Leptosia nina TaxID=320188 RepID=A0AAV1IZS2_9NEOP